MPRMDNIEHISVTEAKRLGWSLLIRAAEAGHDLIILRDNEPVAAVVGMGRYEALRDFENDLADIALAAARFVTAGERRYSLDEVLAQFGYSREQLREFAVDPPFRP